MQRKLLHFQVPCRPLRAFGSVLGASRFRLTHCPYSKLVQDSESNITRLRRQFHFPAPALGPEGPATWSVLPSAYWPRGGAAANIKKAVSTMGADDYEQITVYADEEQKRRIERSAEAAGMSVSSYLRKRGTSEEPIVDRGSREEEIEELKELRRLLGNMSGNLNQVAFHANRTGDISEEGVLRARRIAEEAKEEVIEVLDELY